MPIMRVRGLCRGPEAGAEPQSQRPIDACRDSRWWQNEPGRYDNSGTRYEFRLFPDRAYEQRGTASDGWGVIARKLFHCSKTAGAADVFSAFTGGIRILAWMFGGQPVADVHCATRRSI